MTTTEHPYRVKRPLTEEEIHAVVDAVERASNGAELLDGAVRAIFTALLSDLGERLDDFGPDHRLDPGDYAIPKIQLDALTRAVTSRADEWGTSIHLTLDLINVMPSWYDDPAVLAPVIAVQDRRPYRHDLHISRDAVDVIAACEAHLAALRGFYGADCELYRAALVSWHRQLAGLFSMRLGADTQVTADGAMSLFVHTGSGYVYAIVWHGDRRRCTVDGCTVTIRDDGTADTRVTGAPTPEHEHQPSYPLDAPHPGQWTAHS